MSQTFSLVCHETKQKVWIGQGWHKMSTLYSGNDERMSRLKEFLNATMGKPLILHCDDLDEYDDDYSEWGETGPDDEIQDTRKAGSY